MEGENLNNADVLSLCNPGDPEQKITISTKSTMNKGRNQRGTSDPIVHLLLLFCVFLHTLFFSTKLAEQGRTREGGTDNGKFTSSAIVDQRCQIPGISSLECLTPSSSPRLHYSMRSSRKKQKAESVDRIAMSGKLILWVSLSRSQEGQGEKRVMSRGGVILPSVLPYWKGWAAQAYAGILYQLSATKTSCQRTITCGL